MKTFYFLHNNLEETIQSHIRFTKSNNASWPQFREVYDVFPPRSHHCSPFFFHLSLGRQNESHGSDKWFSQIC